MIVFWPVVLLVAWFEASWWQWLDWGGTSLPLTLLVLLYLRWQGWIDTTYSLLLAAGAGYLLDLLASPRPGVVMIALLISVGLAGWLLSMGTKRWQRAASLAAALLTYQLMLGHSFGWVSWQITLLGSLAFSLVGLIVFGLMLIIGNRVKGWL